MPRRTPKRYRSSPVLQREISPAGIAWSDLVSAFGERRVSGDELGMTATEIAELLHIPIRKARELIKYGLSQDQIIVGRKLVQVISGNWKLHPCYSLKSGGAPRKRK